MSATFSYGALQKRYMPETLIENSLAKVSYVFSNCEKDKSWRGGTYEMPFMEAGFSSLQFGSLAAANDIAEMTVALGTTTMKELWGSILVREADLFRHQDPEQSYLEILPKRVDEFVKFTANQVTAHFLQGSRVAKATVSGTVGGVITVDKIYQFRVGQKVEVVDGDTAAVAGYVTAIDINANTLTIKTARSAGSAVDLSAYTTAQSAVVRIVGTGSEQFSSMKSLLLSAADGGSDTVYGLTRANYTVTQALSADGSGYTATNILDSLLANYYTFAEKRGDVFKEMWVSYGLFKNITRVLEGNRKYVTSDRKAGYGWNSVDIIGAEGQAKIVALREMPNDTIYVGDVKNIKFAGADQFKKKMYNGEEFFMVRGTDGPQWITDMALRGDFIVKPNEWAVIKNVAAAASA